jgi:opacity protein-like surface antigen
MKLRLALAAATCLALPIAAHAQPVTGPYVSVEGGTSILNPTNFSDSYGDTGKLQYKNDYVGIGGIGYGFGNGFRVQIDGDYFRNTASRIDAGGGSFSAKLVGHENRYGGFLNALYDVDVGLPIFPYLGAGVGYEYADTRYQFGDGGIGSQYAFGGSKGSFAYDVIAGVGVPVAMVPGLSLTAEYRFTSATESVKYGFDTLGGVPAGTLGAGTIKVGPQTSHSFLLGLRYALFTPAPPAPAVAPETPVAAAPPAPPPARTYLVFFDWDKSVLTPRALTIISQAASDSKTGTTTIDVSGYTDTSGTPTYNQGLSERRAKAVAGQLVADGVSASEIEEHAYGETHLLVPTGPGVREPQNRRVEIVLQ